MRTLSLLALAAACALPAAQEPEVANAPVVAAPLTLRRIMADPDWFARSPEDARWSADGRAVYFHRKREGVETRDLFRLDVGTGEIRLVEDAERGSAHVDGGDRDAERRVFTQNGDLFLADTDGAVRQLTRTAERESSPAFLADGERVRFRRDGTLLVRELATGLEYQPAELVFDDDPLAEEEDDETDYLAAQQERLFAAVREEEEDRERARTRERELRAADPTRSPVPWYLGEGKESAGTDLSPDGRWLLVRLVDEDRDRGERDTMPEYVTGSSWVETREVRAHVGQTERRATALVLLDLRTRTRHDLDLAVLPEIATDRLSWLDELENGGELESDEEPGNEGEPADGSEEDESAPQPRGVSIRSVAWSADSASVVFLARSNDNKDRWIARVDVETATIEPLHHLYDEAWINWRFSELGWLEDDSGLWFTSEESGFSQLYLWTRATGEIRALTEGRFEVDRVTEHPDGGVLYFRANATHPGVHEVHRVAVAGGPMERVTDLGGRTSGSLSPDGSRLLLVHSRPLAPPELYVQEARPGAEARRMTFTIEDEFLAIDWAEPRIVAVPSRHGAPIHTRVYVPEGEADAPRPVVAFVHGAGYLQNAHFGWSGYFRELMFHSLLVEHGYVVVDADFRASAGYGRDWRTAIYRGMGPPELDDYEDVLAWLDANHDVDLSRVGVYGGSYGGFVTLMGLFQRPDMFACGAALRPVTDWAHYNHGYTSNILNTPERDPRAFEASSPIEFAEGLEDPLLICHGLVDDNVLAKDSIRLAQRLIELEKEDWELALFPVEPHGFRRPSSWLDEYRRIFKLFETHLK